MGLEADGLTVRRGDLDVLRGVSLRVDEGECVSIIGPNGAGKSTLMAAILGLVPIAGGEVRVDGTELRRLSSRDLARRIAYVAQLHEGYGGFTVRDIVEAGRYAHVDPLDPMTTADRDAVRQAAEACRVEHLWHRKVDTLSGGERQKVWIAAALAQQTPTLFLDEPTTALDPAHQADLIRIMRDYAGRGRTLVVIAHDLNLPLALGGRVIAIRDAAVHFDGDTTMLLDTSRLRVLFDTEFVLHRAIDGRGISIQLRTEAGSPIGPDVCRSDSTAPEVT